MSILTIVILSTIIWVATTVTIILFTAGAARNWAAEANHYQEQEPKP